MNKIFGNISGLKKNQLKKIEKFYKRKIPVEFLITKELTTDISLLSAEIKRQIGLLINRAGKIIYIIIGDAKQIMIPDTQDFIAAQGRLKGLRCVHTHLNNEELTNDDLTDLSLLRLDIMAAITINNKNKPDLVHIGVVNPGAEKPYRILPPVEPHNLDIDCLNIILETEADLSKTNALYDSELGKERAYLVGVYTKSKEKLVDSITELKELTLSSGIKVAGTVLQHRKVIDPNFVVGMGKLNELTINALQKGATIIIFDRELTPSQIRSITNHIEMKIIDRTQLILDIFAQRAQSREGKLQVEMAQLKYLLPRLVEKNTALSRLTGGIGGRGPGETKLEINRRRVRDKINKLEKDLIKVQKQRTQQKALRNKKGLPVVSIVGYTNAGKSTLLNTLTQSNILVANKLFATLDPSSRRLRFPKDIEVILTDTVGFIRELPQELMNAFKATLEELESADLLLHVIDISNPLHNEQINSVEKILSDLNLSLIPTIYVYNKKDRLNKEKLEILKNKNKGLFISALDRPTLLPLLDEIEKNISK